MKTLNSSLFRYFGMMLLLVVAACHKGDSISLVSDENALSGYYVQDISKTTSVGKTLLKVNSYQQTTEYSCGPAAVLSLLHHYGRSGEELRIAEEMGTSTQTGTTPDQMSNWLNNNGFQASWHEEGSLEMIRENLANNVPTLLEWSDWGGHWVLVVGYDTRNTESISDDVIIFADPYDRHDDAKDGLTWFNAERFYYMWYDAKLFGRFMSRVYIKADFVQ
ncbi:MAG: C39 family peptidase [Bacteroidales bacterium]